MNFEYLMIGVALLLIASVFASKISDRFGVPVLLLFLALGMLAGSDGPGGIYFDDPLLSQRIGTLALAFILFSGGLDTQLKEVRPIAREGLVLATAGVLITCVLTALMIAWLLKVPLNQALLLGAVISSTDAAAVLSVLRAKGVSLKGKLKPLLEFESGINDPMAVFLTLGFLRLITLPETSPWSLILLFLQQFSIGAVMGFSAGWTGTWLINRVRLGYEGLYSVMTIALVLVTYAGTAVLGGSGFLAVYLAGIVMGERDFIHKRSLTRFHDGLAWIMQVTMFLTLGLLVFPSRLLSVITPGLLIAAILIFVARPISVFLSLGFFKYSLKETVFLSWVGLRGAVPIILATYAYQAGLPEADLMFNVVFFVVMTSTLLQGTSIPTAARWLNLESKVTARPVYPIEHPRLGGIHNELKEIPIPSGSIASGKAIFELDLPDQFLVVLIAREKEFLIPTGGTLIQPGDTLLVLSDQNTYNEIEKVLSTVGNRGPD